MNRLFGRIRMALVGVLATLVPTLASADPADLFVAQLYVREGYLAVDPTRTALGNNIAGLIQNECPSLTPERMHSELITYLDGLLRRPGTVLQQRVKLSPAEFAALLEKDPEAAALASANEAKLAAMDTRLLSWLNANRSLAQSQEGLFAIYKTMLADERLADGPLILDLRNPGDVNELQPWFFRGQVPFSVAAPITADYQRVRPEANADEWKDIRQELAATVLDGLKCRLWYRDEIIARFSDYLEMRGIAIADYRTARQVETLVPRVGMKKRPDDRVGIAPEKPRFVDGRPARLRVIMWPDPLLEGLLLDVPAHDLVTIRRVLYLVLPSDDYSQVVADPSHLCLMTAQAGASTSPMVYVRLRGPDVRLRMGTQYLTRRFLAERLRYLQTLGFTATPTFFAEVKQQGKPPLHTAHLLIARATPPSETPATATPPASGAPVIRPCGDPPADAGQAKAADSPALRFDRGQDTVRPESFANESSRKDSRSRAQEPEPERRNQLRLGVEYEATRPLRYTLSYTRSGLTGADDALSAQLGFQDEPSGDVQYNRDFVLFDVLNRRLQLSARAFSDFTPDRRLPSGRVDERRTGGEAGAKLDLWRDVNAQWAQLDVHASWRESRVTPDRGPETRNALTLLDLGLVYLRSWDGTASARRVEVQPVLTLGYADDRDRPFQRAALDARVHQFIGAFTQWESRLRGAAAFGSIPDVELPSFGGQDSVRGYRPDAGLARTTWALQNELWLPVRLPFDLPAGIATLLRRNAALAVLGDVGGLHDSRDSFSGVKGAAGLGLRFVWQDTVTLRLDWVHALGDRSRTQDAGMVYFAVTTRPSF